MNEFKHICILNIQMAAITESHQANTNSQEVERVFTINVSNVKADKGGSSTQEDFGFVTEICDEKGHKFFVIGVLDGHGQRGREYSQEVGKVMQKTVEIPGFCEAMMRDPQAAGANLFQAGQDCAFELFKAILKERDIHYTVDSQGQVLLDYGTIDHMISDVDEVTCTRGQCREEKFRLPDGPKVGAKGGTTATLVFIGEDGSVITMNAGDTDAWSITGSTQSKLTSDHQPTSSSEHERICRDFPESSRAISIFDRPQSTPPHPKGDLVFVNREFGGYSVKNVDREPATYLQFMDDGGLSHTSYKLAVTRSIGDFVMRRGGVISEPSVSRVQMENDTVVLIATDGYWDNIVSENIGATTNLIVTKHGLQHANMIATEWFEDTEKAARRNFGSYRDNMLGYVITLEKKRDDDNDRFNSLSSCGCCTRHQRLKPVFLEPWKDTLWRNTEIGGDADHMCTCDCRHVMRNMCRDVSEKR